MNVAEIYKYVTLIILFFLKKIVMKQAGLGIENSYLTIRDA